MTQPLHSIVVPCFNEEPVVAALLTRLESVLPRLGEFEVVAVDDGSRDGTFELLRSAAEDRPWLKVVRLSRNFGHQTAITAGLDFASGDTVTVIDADLQDPPEVIPELVAEWERGADIVFAVRADRSGETWFKRVSAAAFYRLISRLAQVDLPLDAGDFRLMSRRAVEALRGMRERSRYVRGLVGWIGLERAFVRYARDARTAGETKYPLMRMLRLAMDGIVSFSIRPLQVATYLGLATSAAAFVYGIYVVVFRLLSNAPVPGWTSLMVVTLFLGGVQLTTIGIVGEYVGRIFEEVKGRPLYLVRESAGFAEAHVSRLPERGTDRELLG